MPAHRHPRRHLPLAVLLGALVAWPLVHHAPPATCPPDAISCPVKPDIATSQLVIIDRPQ